MMTDIGKDSYPQLPEIMRKYGDGAMQIVDVANELYGSMPPANFWELVEFQAAFRRKYGYGINEQPKRSLGDMCGYLVGSEKWL